MIGIDNFITGKRANFCERRCYELHIDWTWTDRSIDDGWSATWKADELYPQQSVSKFWVAVTALRPLASS